MSFKRTLLIIGALLLPVLLAACGGGGGSSSGGGNPADAAKSFLTAIYTGQGDPMTYVCAAGQAQAQQMKTGLQAIAAQGATVDASGLTFTTQNQSGDTAQVAVGGTLKVTVSGVSSDVPMSNLVIPMKNENGWKVCGA
jgi:hypothetical protein